VSTYLDVRTAWTVVERRLTEVLEMALAVKRRAADLAALEAAPSDQIPDGALCFVESDGVQYRFRAAATSGATSPPMNNALVVRPSDRAGAGRWLRQSSTAMLGPHGSRPVSRTRTGYARVVQLYQGELSLQAALTRIYGQRPAILVTLSGDEVKTKSTVAGSLYEANYDFQVLVISNNYRPQQQALYGSDVAEEAEAVGADPGINRMIGDVRYVLAGSDLGLGPGVKYADIQGRTTVVEEDLGERLFVASVPITVRASFHIPDEDLIPFSELWLQMQVASFAAEGGFDESNYVVRGFFIASGAGVGLVGTPSGGAAYVDGVAVESTPDPHLFTASRDTYRDLLPSGLLVYAEVAIDAQAPPVPDGALRIGCTRTDATDITADWFLCPVLSDWGEPFRAWPS